jgi:ABC-2 type transport system permease protein
MSPSPPPPPLSAGRFLRAMLRAEWLSLRARAAGIRKGSRLLHSVLAAFVCGYLGAGYWLFLRGFDYVQNFPVLGTLLSQRILFLMFGFFFVMLVFSNTITGYATFFRNRETEWLVTLPVRHRHVWLWKFFETLAVSSWALLFLSAPLLAAYGTVHRVEPWFYLKVALAFVPFVVVPGAIASLLLLLLVRAASSGWLRRSLPLLGAAIIASILFGIRPVSESQTTSIEEFLTFEQLLSHTRHALHPGLPSSWMAEAVLAWVERLGTRGWFFLLLVVSNALFGLVLAYEIAGRGFFATWSHALSHRTIRRSRRAARRAARGPGPVERLLNALPIGSRTARALFLKDARIFWRDPAQWTQFTVFFALLCLYVLNLRNVAYDFSSEFWTTLISHMNLAASSLTLSTLTTRFVFPQFSLEGRRLWILGMAPAGLPSVLLIKFWIGLLAASAVTLPLMTLSGLILNLGWPRILMFNGAMLVIGAGLTGLAVGLGALFPNLREENPAKIVSGFGGTLCLVSSFVFLLVTLMILALPDILRFTRGLPLELIPRLRAVAFTAAFVFALATALVPLVLARARVKNLEF